MEIGATDPTPDLGDLLQEEPFELPLLSTVPVSVRGEVLTHDLPARRVQAKTDVVPVASWTNILPGTLKRARVTLISTDKPFYYSIDGTGVTGAIWPANVALVLRNAEKVYIMSADASLSATVTHITELWAD